MIREQKRVKVPYIQEQYAFEDIHKCRKYEMQPPIPMTKVRQESLYVTKRGIVAIHDFYLPIVHLFDRNRLKFRVVIGKKGERFDKMTSEIDGRIILFAKYKPNQNSRGFTLRQHRLLDYAKGKIMGEIRFTRPPGGHDRRFDRSCELMVKVMVAFVCCNNSPRKIPRRILYDVKPVGRRNISILLMEKKRLATKTLQSRAAHHITENGDLVIVESAIIKGENGYTKDIDLSVVIHWRKYGYRLSRKLHKEIFSKTKHSPFYSDVIEQVALNYLSDDLRLLIRLLLSTSSNSYIISFVEFLLKDICYNITDTFLPYKFVSQPISKRPTGLSWRSFLDGFGNLYLFTHSDCNSGFRSSSQSLGRSSAQSLFNCQVTRSMYLCKQRAVISHTNVKSFCHVNTDPGTRHRVIFRNSELG
jgi:hypothetical protein